MLSRLSKTETIILSAFVFVLLLLAFGWVHSGVGKGPLLDTLLTGSDARDRLAAMLPNQIRHHLIGTATIDMAYPLAYGA